METNSLLTTQKNQNQRISYAKPFKQWTVKLCQHQIPKLLKNISTMRDKYHFKLIHRIGYRKKNK